jgi:hypothetical protein
MTQHFTRNTVSVSQYLDNERLRTQIERDLDADYEAWKRKLGGKVTWGQRMIFYRDRLVLEIYERRRGIQ